jgi:hypothetical protein
MSQDDEALERAAALFGAALHSKQRAWIVIAFIVLSLIAVGMAGALYHILTKPKPEGSESVIAKPAPAVSRAPTEFVPVKSGKVQVKKGDSKKNLKLPAEIQADDKKQVIAAVQAPGSLRPQTISTVLDTETGKSESFIKTDPYPWFAWEPRGEAKLAYGFKFDAKQHQPKQVGRLQLGYDMVRVKALTVGVTGTLDSDRDAFIGVGLTYRW